MDDVLLRILARLLRIEAELGSAAYHDAAHQALVAIGRSVNEAVQQQAGFKKESKGAVLVFPISRTRRPPD